MQNAKGSAGKMGFLETIPNTVSEQYEGPKDKNGNEEEADDIGGTYMEIRGGTVEELPAGKKFAQYAPNYPHEQHTPFVRTNGREIARGVGGDYTAMYGDRENESFSSTKAGEQENRASNFYHQSLIRRVENKIYEIFVRYALLYNQLGNLKYSSIDRYLENYYFWGITKPWLDPYKESVSNEINKRNGWVSDNQVIQSNGGRMEDVFADKKMKMDYEKKFGFKLEEPKETPAVNDKQKDDTNKKDDASKDDNAENVDDNAKRNLKIMKM
jgi:capsid protein